MNETVSVVIIVLLLINLIGLLMVGARITSQSTDSRQMERRLTVLEARVDNLPTHRDLTGLRQDISEVVETVATISGQTTTMTQMLRSIQEYLLEKER